MYIGMKMRTWDVQITINKNPPPYLNAKVILYIVKNYHKLITT